MKTPFSQSSPTEEASARHSRWLWFSVTGGVLLILIALILQRPGYEAANKSDSNVSEAPKAAAKLPLARKARGLQPAAASDPAATAQEIVAAKVSQFARNRREIVHAISKHFGVAVPAEVEHFFDLADAGRWKELDDLYESLKKRREDMSLPSEVFSRFFPVLNEVLGVTEAARDWPAQKLLDYGNAVLGSLRPGMVYVGGTDAGRYIPTLLNETSDGEPHVVLTQNAFADLSYLNYATFLYGDHLATLAQEDSERAFQDYIADARKRLEHDQQFSDEPKQLRPGEDVRLTDNRVQVSGQVAVMAINEKLLQALMQKNPDATFAMEESFPFNSTFAEATTLGPVMELRVRDEQSALT